MKHLHVGLEPLRESLGRLRESVGAGTLYETCGMGITADWVEMARRWLYRIGVEDDPLTLF
jgi:hypothetical protein